MVSQSKDIQRAVFYIFKSRVSIKVECFRFVGGNINLFRFSTDKMFQQPTQGREDGGREREIKKEREREREKDNI